MKNRIPPWLIGCSVSLAILLLLAFLLAFQNHRRLALSQPSRFRCKWCSTTVIADSRQKPPIGFEIHESLLEQWPKVYREGRPPACGSSPSQQHEWLRLSRAEWIRSMLPPMRPRYFDIGRLGVPDFNLTTQIRYQPYGLIGYAGTTVALASTRHYFIIPVSLPWLTAGPCALALLAFILHGLWRRSQKAS